jgi:hypothetical protein
VISCKHLSIHVWSIELGPGGSRVSGTSTREGKIAFKHDDRFDYYRRNRVRSWQGTSAANTTAHRVDHTYTHTRTDGRRTIYTTRRVAGNSFGRSESIRRHWESTKISIRSSKTSEAIGWLPRRVVGQCCGPKVSRPVSRPLAPNCLIVSS